MTTHRETLTATIRGTLCICGNGSTWHGCDVRAGNIADTIINAGWAPTTNAEDDDWPIVHAPCPGYPDCRLAPGKHEHMRAADNLPATVADEAYQRGEWCGQCRYGVVEDPPCCTHDARAELAELRARIEALCGRLRPITGEWHAVVEGQHLPPCIACLILAEIDALDGKS